MIDDHANARAADDLTLWDRIAHTPLSNALRREWKKRPTVNRIIQEHRLPQSIAVLVRTIVKSTRLWRRERLDVTRELAAHFADGLEVGRSTDDLIESFGDPQQAARLIRITKKRNRPLWWRASRNTLRGLAVTIALVIVFYGALAARFFMGSPTISHDYVKEINRVAAAAPQDSRAWPLYRQALLALEDRPLVVLNESPSVHKPPSQEYREYLIRNAAAFDLVRQAASLPFLGYEAAHEISEADRELWPDFNPGDPAIGVYGVMLPYLTPFRDLARLLVADTVRAAEDGDADTVLRNIDALVRKAGHVREHPILICDLVALSIFALVQDTTGGLLEVNPNLFSDEDLIALAHMIGSALGGDLRVRIESERYSFRDFLQRAFTDDGRGGGRLTPEGVRFISRMTMVDPDDEHGLLKWTLSPGASLVMANRREMQAMWDDLFNEMLADAALPMWQRNVGTDQRVESMAATFDRVRYMPIVALFPALSHATAIGDRGALRRDGILVAIAAELNRRRYGDWPASLRDLEPHLLPRVPIDRFDGQPLRYVVRDGRPIIYSVGTNRKDNGGVPPVDQYGNVQPENAMRFVPQSRLESFQQTWPSWVVPEGDWILWPRVRTGQE